MQILATVDQLAAARREWRGKLAFVPTMGALHEGHLSLVRRAREVADLVLASIFVNPTQFGPGEDLDRYPRTLEADIALLEKEGVHACFTPGPDDIYPRGFQTWVSNDLTSGILCGASRPVHFRGVLTVVLKLFQLTRPDVAVFGLKDYQQYSLIRLMVRDLALGLDVIGAPTVREEDGLAMSSRNRMLEPEHRRQAVAIYQGLQAADALFRKGERQATALVDAWRQVAGEVPAIEPEYMEVRCQGTLEEYGDVVDEQPVMLVAARMGQVRLIDNLELGGRQ